MANSIEKGSSGDTFTWDGNLSVGGAITATGSVTAGGAVSSSGGTVLKKQVIPLTAAAITAASTNPTLAGWSIPAGSVVHRAYFILSVKAAETPRTISIGTTDTATELINALPVGSGISPGFFDCEPTITAGATETYWTASTNYVGTALLKGFIAGTNTASDFGVFSRKVAYYAADTPVKFLMSGATTAAAGSIIIEYM